MVNATNMNREEQIELLKMMREAAHKEAEAYAKELGSKVPLLATTVKPEGTLSQLPTVSSGVHYSHSPYYMTSSCAFVNLAPSHTIVFFASKF